MNSQRQDLGSLYRKNLHVQFPQVMTIDLGKLTITGRVLDLDWDARCSESVSMQI